MASRVSIKQGRKDRPRSSTLVSDGRLKKKQSGTPEKSTTPSASCGDFQELDGMRRTIVNDEILALQVKPEDLLKYREPKPPEERKTTPVFNSVLVKKLKPSSDNDKQKTIVVIKPAPVDSPLKARDYSHLAGPKFDHSKNIIPHSILGDVEDFIAEATKRGDLPPDTPMQTDRTSSCLTVKYGKKRPVGYPNYKSANKSNALKNWETNMAVRRRQQNYLSRVLNKPADLLVMNQSDEYRRIQELRYLIERTVPFITPGTCHHVGTEFWAQPTAFGGELNGLFTTLTETEKGFPPSLMHVGVPENVLTEKGLSVMPPAQPFRKPWHKAPYLRERVMQLAPLMDELDPHEPEIHALEVVGKSRPVAMETEAWPERLQTGCSTADGKQSSANPTLIAIDSKDPVRNHPDVYPEAIFGPSIQFGGFAAAWTGDTQCNKGEVGIEARVNFEAYAGERTMSFLEIGNNGTAAMYYDWKKVPKDKPFEMLIPRVQRFYFNQSNGVLLPGDMLKFPFVFKSPNAGVFSEQWEFQSHPVVCGGAKLLVTLRGVALKQDKFEQHRAQLEEELHHRQANQVVTSLFEDLLNGIKTPERARSPVDAYITDEELFCRRNPNLYFNNDKVTELNKLYADVLPEEDKQLPWDLRLETIKQAIMTLPDDDDHKEEFLHQFNDIITSLSFRPFMSNCVTTYTAGPFCRSLLSQTVDRIVRRDDLLRSLNGVPDRFLDPAAAAVPEMLSDVDDELDMNLDLSENRGKGKKDPKDKKGGKDAKQPAGKGKDLLIPGQQGSRSSGGNKSGSQLSVQQQSSQGALSTTASSTAQAEPSVDDQLLQAKYKNKLYTQTYLELCDLANEMESVFEDLLDRVDQSPLSCP